MKAVLLGSMALAVGCSASAEELAPQPDAPVEEVATFETTAPEVSTIADADAFVEDAAPRRTAAAGTYFYNLKSAPFPGSGHPDVAVRVPKGFDSSNRPGAVVFFHGFNNCVATVIASADAVCTPGQPARGALQLSDQLDAAKVNAILIAVQLRFDEATGAVGQLAKAGNFKELLHELLTEHLNAELVKQGMKAIDVDDLERIVIGSHSGGYQAAATVISVGGVKQITEVDLFDSLYGNIAQYDTWMQSQIARFDVARADDLRFANTYTTGGGTAANSRAMAGRAKNWLTAASLVASLLFDDTFSTLDPPAFTHPALFKLTSIAHGTVPRYYFSRFLAPAGFATIP